MNERFNQRFPRVARLAADRVFARVNIVLVSLLIIVLLVMQRSGVN
jgi:hypothetical protein